MAVGISTIWGFFINTIWPLLKELLFGKYRLADYFRTRKIVLLLLFFFILMTVMFINMTENALVSNQHIRHISGEYETRIATLEAEVKKQSDLAQSYRNRLVKVCSGKDSYYCRGRGRPDIENVGDD